MKKFTFIAFIVILIASCGSGRQATSAVEPDSYSTVDTFITQSLFNDRNSGISEENIRRILDGEYQLPEKLRVAIVRLENPQQRTHYRYYWANENYLKTQQSYLDLFALKFKESPRVTDISIIPDIIISKSPTYTSLREAAVRMQADIVVVYSVTSDLYSKYKLFSKSEVKAFATTQLVVVDVRTGLIPFSSIVTMDVLSQKKKEELDLTETQNRVQHEAVLLTIDEIGKRIAGFLNKQ